MLLSTMVLVVALAIAGLLLLLRVADLRQEQDGRRMVVAAASCLAAAIAVRFLDTIMHPDTIRLSNVIAAVAFAAYLYQERRARKAARGAPPTA